MADSNVINLTKNTAPLGSDLEYMVDDPNGTPADNGIYKGDNNIGPDGFIKNGKISVTVASNNITVAIKTKSDGNPSATDPVSVWINGSYRRITAALSVTKNAGTQWFGLGANFAALEQQFFVYLIWNTTPGTDIMDIAFARRPDFRVFSEGSTTTTNQNYIAFGNASTPTSTDAMINIGRFSATLSAAASYNWSVPTFTNANLIQTPYFKTDWLVYAPTITGYSANPTNTVYRYRLDGNDCYYDLWEGASGTSNATTKTYTAPFTAKTITNKVWLGTIPLPHNNTADVAAGFSQISSADNIINMFLTAGGAWTNSGSARVKNCWGRFEV